MFRPGGTGGPADPAREIETTLDADDDVAEVARRAIDREKLSGLVPPVVTPMRDVPGEVLAWRERRDERAARAAGDDEGPRRRTGAFVARAAGDDEGPRRRTGAFALEDYGWRRGGPTRRTW
ncbi:hypothetical protein [Zhihengliuella sp.]|uniref:hypothetical protein n=1 Tax=Zhihengliuella sp. TaxID=1954483 RepID=UPI002811D161|nr:hypothetical protein [Zhihengliuella sp.]